MSFSDPIDIDQIDLHAAVSGLLSLLQELDLLIHI